MEGREWEERGGEGKGRRWAGREGKGEVDTDAQLEQGRRLAIRPALPAVQYNAT